MYSKKQARELPHNTGNTNYSTKNTKRKRTTNCELTYKWSQTPKNCVKERIVL